MTFFHRFEMPRFADDFVMVFENHDDCRRVEKVLSKRFERHKLTLNPEKTRCVDFRPDYRKENRNSVTPCTFDFLGFTHFWGVSRRGNTAVYQKTAKGRLSRTLKAFHDYCRKTRHKPPDEQCAGLNRKLRGHYAYFGITGNAKALGMIHHKVKGIWHKWLSRRSQKSRITWDKFHLFLGVSPCYRQKSTISITTISQRTNGGEEPDALIALVRLCEG